MRAAVCSVLLTLIVAVSAPLDGAAAEELMLQRSFWSGWKYSHDGTNFEKIGTWGRDLRAEFEGNPTAQAEMSAYGSNHIWSGVLGAAGGGLAIAAAFKIDDEDEFDGTSIGLLTGGAVLAIISGVLEISATNHLLKAVHLYNFGDPGDPGGADLGGRRDQASARLPHDVGVGVAFEF
jgi:hypothetical protein